MCHNLSVYFTRHRVIDGSVWRGEAQFLDSRGQVVDSMPVVFDETGYSKYCKSEVGRDGKAVLLFDTIEFVPARRFDRLLGAGRLRLTDGFDVFEVRVEKMTGRENHGFYFRVEGEVVDARRTEARFEDLVSVR
jgi:hypothetical protein